MEEIEAPVVEMPSKQANRSPWVWDLLLLGILMLGAYFRFVGINWDGNQHLHPDERFLTMVETSITPVKGLSEYFDTAQSSLNPHNNGYGFYVYGTLPLFLVRYAADAFGMTGYDEVHILGRFASGLFDLGTVFLVFLIVSRLYRNPRMALLAAAFSAFSVMQIQLSHFFAVDTFANFFIWLSMYFAIRVLTGEEKTSAFIFFGMALGMAMASKVSTAPAAALLPAALVIRYLKMDGRQASQKVLRLGALLAVAAVVSILVFRVLQPYAFSGPGFFGLIPNPKWIDNIKEIGVQSSGKVDFPPALQWARRPIWFAWENMVKWGLGLPLGILAWAAFLWMGWRMLRGEWDRHTLIWVWVGLYYAWQSSGFVPAMRYQVPVYPGLAIIAAWGVISLWEKGRTFKPGWWRISASILGVGVLVASAGWAYAFSRIYTRPVTRVAGSQWIYENVPGAINFHMEEEGKLSNLPLSFPSGLSITGGDKVVLEFQPHSSGLLTGVTFSNIKDPKALPIPKTLAVSLAEGANPESTITTAYLYNNFIPTQGQERGDEFTAQFDEPQNVDSRRKYYLILDTDRPENEFKFSGTISVILYTESGETRQFLADPMEALLPGKDFVVSFKPLRDGMLQEIAFPRIVNWSGSQSPSTLKVTLASTVEQNILVDAKLESTFTAGNDPRGESYTIKVNPPVKMSASSTYTLRLEFAGGSGMLALYGSKPAVETSWDDPLPLGLPGYASPFDYNNGLYRTDLNFEMYWDDTAEKRERFYNILDQTDYIFISSNRQWGTTTRVEERYPLTSAYYRALLGCPAEKTVTWCYSVAEPGMFESRLGFDLVHIEQSDPNLGPWRFNTQFAEEAFTVYDHPKVLIFKKQPDYNPQNARDILGVVDLSKVIHVPPGDVKTRLDTLMLPSSQLARQQAGGTWSELFNRQSPLNRFPALGMAAWYLVITLLGWAVMPLVRIVFGGLVDKGYPLGKLAGMMLLAYLTWLAGSAGIAFAPLTISLIAVFLLGANILLFFLQREEIQSEFRSHWRYYLLIEMAALLLFLFFLLIRLGNPDLWHPYKGGEKPMDFSYLNAVIKSTTFPPYDPWFAGGYLNYYYYGMVLAGVPIKWLGIIPSIGYNLVLPTFFSFTGMAAFCAGWNLYGAWRGKTDSGEMEGDARLKWFGVHERTFLAGVFSSLMMLVLGNWGTVRMIWHGLMRIAAPGGTFENSNIFQRWLWTVQGLGKYFSGTPLPYPPGDWYWIPSRAIPGEPITEFPFFTYLYADPHAHLYALPLTVMALCWGLSVLMRRWNWGDGRERHAWLNASLTFLTGAVVIGSLRPANTWDMPVYLVLGMAAVLYSALVHGGNAGLSKWLAPVPARWTVAILGVAGLAGFSFLLYQPYAAWYGAGYTEVQVWEGAHTPFFSYLTHWGVFLFLIVTWMFWETRDWMANTPVSALNDLRPYRGSLIGLGVMALVVIALLGVLGVEIAIIPVILGLWATALLLRPGQADNKRAVLFLVGSAMLLTLAVELIVLKGDIGRMNTVFKFYLQAWTLLSLSAAASLAWLMESVPATWAPRLTNTWRVTAVILLSGAAMFTIMGGMDKIRDRMDPNAPHSLDGMAYMATASYNDNGVDYPLDQDYHAIRWMQDNVKGSPVIVEGNTPEYRWGSRFTIYTGLPGVVGWNWHQRQQRSNLTPSEWVTNRVDEIGEFYTTTEHAWAESFLRRYQVRYVVVGLLERANFPGPGLDKFSEWNGDLWTEVFRDRDTSIYRVDNLP